MADLIADDDSDLIDYVSDQEAGLTARESFIVRSAGEIVRDYCGWHISPSIAETIGKVRIGGQGIIMLPSRYVTAVSSLTITSPAGDVLLDGTTDYDWYQSGYIEAKTPLWRYGYGQYGHSTPGLASVALEHGYDECPLPVKSVVFELMQTASVETAGNVKAIASPGYHIQWGNLDGATLNAGQISRLSKYRIENFG